MIIRIHKKTSKNKKILKINLRKGCISIDGEPVKKDESPLVGDQEGEWLHKFVANGF